MSWLKLGGFDNEMMMIKGIANPVLIVIVSAN